MIGINTSITVVQDANGNNAVQPTMAAPPVLPTIPPLLYIAQLSSQFTNSQADLMSLMTALNVLSTAGVDVSALINQVQNLITTVSDAVPAQVATPPRQIKQ